MVLRGNYSPNSWTWKNKKKPISWEKKIQSFTCGWTWRTWGMYKQKKSTCPGRLDWTQQRNIIQLCFRFTSCYTCNPSTSWYTCTGVYNDLKKTWFAYRSTIVEDNSITRIWRRKPIENKNAKPASTAGWIAQTSSESAMARPQRLQVSRSTNPFLS